jgi:hypothetical protein
VQLDTARRRLHLTTESATSHWGAGVRKTRPGRRKGVARQIATKAHRRMVWIFLCARRWAPWLQSAYGGSRLPWPRPVRGSTSSGSRRRCCATLSPETNQTARRLTSSPDSTAVAAVRVILCREPAPRSRHRTLADLIRNRNISRKATRQYEEFGASRGSFPPWKGKSGAAKGRRRPRRRPPWTSRNASWLNDTVGRALITRGGLSGWLLRALSPKRVAHQAGGGGAPPPRAHASSPQPISVITTMLSGVAGVSASAERQRWR